MKIAVTGGIGSGKSTVAKLLLETLPDAVLISIDEIIAEIYKNIDHYPLIKDKLLELFNTTDKKIISTAVINDTTNLTQLEEVFNDEVRSRLYWRMDSNANDYIIVEIPLLFEMDVQFMFSYIINVDAPYDVRKLRVQERDGDTTGKRFKFFEERQLTSGVRQKKSNITIINEELQNTQNQIDLISIIIQIKNKNFNPAIVSGSFDPITNGHVDLINQANKLFDSVIVVVSTNEDKPNGMFNLEERVNLIKQTIKSYPSWINVFVVVLPPRQFLFSYIKQFQPRAIIRGIRNTTDFIYEQQIDLVQSTQESTPTVYMMVQRNNLEVSSSLIRSLYKLDGWQNIIWQYVPLPVFDTLLKKLNN